MPFDFYELDQVGSVSNTPKSLHFSPNEKKQLKGKGCRESTAPFNVSTCFMQFVCLCVDSLRSFPKSLFPPSSTLFVDVYSGIKGYYHFGEIKLAHNQSTSAKTTGGTWFFEFGAFYY
jgi:hypothetical protein